MRAMVPKALDVLEKSLEEGADPKQRMAAALAVLRAAGLGTLEVPKVPAKNLVAYDHDLEAIVDGVGELPGFQGFEWPDLSLLDLEARGRV